MALACAVISVNLVIISVVCCGHKVYIINTAYKYIYTSVCLSLHIT